MIYTKPVMWSLKQIATVNIAVYLWKQADIKASILRLNAATHTTHAEWEAIEASVKSKATELSLPMVLERRTADVIGEVGMEIFRWVEVHQVLCSRTFALEFATELQWNSSGAVNADETARALVETPANRRHQDKKRQEIDVKLRFVLACVYCLERHIRLFWEQLSDSGFWKDNRPRLVLVDFWCDVMEREATHYGPWDRLYGYFFDWSATNGKLAATKYFWRHLTPEEQAESVIRVTLCVARCCNVLFPVKWREFGDFHRVVNAELGLPGVAKEDLFDVLCFLLSEMSEAQQTELFQRDNQRNVLMCLWHWPRHDFFMTAVSRLWSSLSAEGYFVMLLEIVGKIRRMQVPHVETLSQFERFWKESPVSHRNYVVEHMESRGLLSKLGQISDTSYMQLIVNPREETHL